MRKKSFNQGMGKLMNRGYSKQRAFDIMRSLAKKNRCHYQSSYIILPSWTKYVVAIIFELILVSYNVPSKEDAQIMMLKTIIPLSPATQPLYPIITILAILMQLFTFYAICDLIIKIKESF